MSLRQQELISSVLRIRVLARLASPESSLACYHALKWTFLWVCIPGVLLSVLRRHQLGWVGSSLILTDLSLKTQCNPDPCKKRGRALMFWGHRDTIFIVVCIYTPHCRHWMVFCLWWIEMATLYLCQKMSPSICSTSRKTWLTQVSTASYMNRTGRTSLNTCPNPQVGSLFCILFERETGSHCVFQARLELMIFLFSSHVLDYRCVLPYLAYRYCIEICFQNTFNFFLLIS